MSTRTRVALKVSDARNKGRSRSSYTAVTSDFRKLVTQSDVVLDKSEFIVTFLETASDVVVINRPSGFGKSTNINMLKLFLQVETNSKFSEEDIVERKTKWKASWAHKLFVEGIATVNGNDENQQQSNRFEKPFIVASSTRLVEKYLAQSPVIFLDLAHFVAQDMNGLIGEAAFGFSNCFFEHSYIMQILHDRSEDTKRGMGERVRYRTWLGEFRSVLESSTSQAKLSRSIRLLCDILSEVFSSPVFLMVDNYDVPFVHIRRHWEVLKMRTQGIEFLRQIFTLVLDAQNPGLKRALLAGRFYIQDGSTRGRRSEIGDHKFAPYFGVYEHEFNDLLTYNDESRNADRIREQYCGFLTDRDRNGDRRACNPASLFNYLQLKMLHCFVNGEEISLVKSLLENGLLRKNLETLIAEGEVEIGLESSKINFERLQKLEFLSDMTPADVELLLSYLYHAGFLTVKEDYKSLGDDQLHAVIVPNNETRSALLDLITEHYMGTCGFSLAQLDEVSITISKLLYSKNDCNVKPLKEAFTELIRPIQLAKFDSAGGGMNPNEDIFHSLINVASIRVRVYKFGTEVYIKAPRLVRGTAYNEGHVDLLMTRLDVGLIIEMKCEFTNPREGSDYGLEQAQSYSPIFEKHPTTVNVRKYVVVRVNKDKTVTVECESEGLDE